LTDEVLLGPKVPDGSQFSELNNHMLVLFMKSFTYQQVFYGGVFTLVLGKLYTAAIFLWLYGEVGHLRCCSGNFVS